MLTQPKAILWIHHPTNVGPHIQFNPKTASISTHHVRELACQILFICSQGPRQNPTKELIFISSENNTYVHVRRYKCYNLNLTPTLQSQPVLPLELLRRFWLFPPAQGGGGPTGQVNRSTSPHHVRPSIHGFHGTSIPEYST